MDPRRPPAGPRCRGGQPSRPRCHSPWRRWHRTLGPLLSQSRYKTPTPPSDGVRRPDSGGRSFSPSSIVSTTRLDWILDSSGRSLRFDPPRLHHWNSGSSPQTSRLARISSSYPSKMSLFRKRTLHHPHRSDLSGPPYGHLSPSCVPLEPKSQKGAAPFGTAPLSAPRGGRTPGGKSYEWISSPSLRRDRRRQEPVPFPSQATPSPPLRWSGANLRWNWRSAGQNG